MLHARPDYQPIQPSIAWGPDIPEDEPVFLIRGKDQVSGDAVRAWADLAEAAGADPAILKAARDHASLMDAWPKKKIPDMPNER